VRRFIRGESASRLFASILIGTMVAGCSGSAHVAPVRPASGTSSSVPDKTTIQQLNLPQLKLGPNGNVNPHKFTPVQVPYIGSSSHRRSTKATVQTPNEQQVAGITFSANDAQGAQTNELTFLGSANLSTTLPNPSSGTNYLISPDTLAGSDSCIELKTVYFRNAGDASTTREVHVFDTCTQTEFRIATIDANFITTYTHDYGTGGTQYFADLKKVGATWQVFLNNFVTNAFDSLYTAPGAAPAPAGGQSTLNIDTFVVGNCPQLGQQNAEAFQIASANGTSPPVWATLAPYSPNAPRSASGAADCFDNTTSTWPDFYYIRYGNGTPGYVSWSVGTSTSAASPSPTPTAIPTATPVPTATPTPAPTATPTPSPTPTATPKPTPRIFEVTQNISTLNVYPGQTTLFPCYISIHTYDPIEERIQVTDSTLPQGFPVLTAPVPSDVSWAVPDFSSTFKRLNNSPPPFQVLYQVLRGRDETHCVDLSITTPSTQRWGTYHATITYQGYARANPRAGLYFAYGYKIVHFDVYVVPTR
jgi:hypothetical protein